MARSVAIIGAGQIGFAACYPFLNGGWDVSLYSRTAPDWGSRWGHCNRFVQYVRGKDALPQADVVIDTIAFDEDDVADYQADKIGRLITISSASVYCDDSGRTLDEAAQNGFPQFNRLITEEQSTVAPGPTTYSTRKIRMENKAGELFGDRATVLRPCAIYGEKSQHPREWWFVKRLLDGRHRIPLAYNGRSQFQTTCAMTIADVAHNLAERDLGGVFNIQDQDAPSVMEIGTAIAQHFECKLDLIPVEGRPDAGVGCSPWAVPLPFVTSGRNLNASGIQAGRQYQDDVASVLGVLARESPKDWRAAFPQLAAYPWDLFDYKAEDRFLASL